jgi:hypothetical protein
MKHLSATRGDVVGFLLDAEGRIVVKKDVDDA